MHGFNLGKWLVRLMAGECALACGAFAYQRNIKMAIYWGAAAVINAVIGW
jgi:hypothetical protein